LTETLGVMCAFRGSFSSYPNREGINPN
jgi:hypothetical protein